jgi:hypothetical protein
MTTETETKPETWQVLATAGSVQEAENLRFRLESAEIPVQLWDNHLIALNPWLKHAVGGIRIAVPEGRLEDARRVLAQNQEENNLSDDELARQALEASPAETEKHPVKPLTGKDVALGIAIVGAVLWLLYGIGRLN